MKPGVVDGSGHEIGKARGRMTWHICGIIRRLVLSGRKKKKDSWGAGLSQNLLLIAPNSAILHLHNREGRA